MPPDLTTEKKIKSKGSEIQNVEVPPILWKASFILIT